MEADQAIEKIASGPEAVSVNEIDALLYLPGHPRQAGITLSMTFSCCRRVRRTCTNVRPDPMRPRGSLMGEGFARR